MKRANTTPPISLKGHHEVHAAIAWLWAIGERPENWSKYFTDRIPQDIRYVFNSWDRSMSARNGPRKRHVRLDSF